METYAINPDDVREAVRAALQVLDLRELVRLEAQRLQRVEDQRHRSEMERQWHAREEAARLAKAAMLREAARLGPIQLRFTSSAAPDAIQWVPALPPGTIRR